MASVAVRRAIQSEFSSQGLTLDKEALAQLAAHVEGQCDSDRTTEAQQECIAHLLDSLDAGVTAKITGAAAAQLLSRLVGSSGGTAGGIQIIPAFDVPSIKYDPIRRAFYRASGGRSLLGSAQDKRSVYLDRFQLLQQQVRRNAKFCPPAFGGLNGDQRQYVELTEIKALRGSTGQTRFVMGCISQPEDGRYALEDPSEAVQMDLTGAITTSGFYTENCIVMAEGSLHANGTFRVTALGFPPIESRSDSLAAAKGLDFFGGVPVAAEDMGRMLQWEGRREADRIVVLSDLWLDKPDTLDRLEVVLEGFEGLEEPPSTFVFMGSFASVPCGSHGLDAATARSQFTSLGTCLANFQRLMETSTFIFVPGPGDMGPGNILPRPPLPKALTADLRRLVPNAVFTTNPARMRWGSQEIVLFRGDVSAHMRALSLLPPDSSTSDPAVQFAHVCATLLQQAHLCPLPLEAQPVYWQYDAALHLYPLPDALILADSAPMASHSFATCQCMNPGQIRQGTFAAYAPLAQEVELCDLPDDDED